MGTGSFPGGKERPGRDADPSPPSSAVVMKEKSYTSFYTSYGPNGLYRASVPVQWCALPTISRPTILFFFFNFCFVYIDSFFLVSLISIPSIYISFTFIFVLSFSYFLFFNYLFSFHTHRVCTSLNHNLLLCTPIYRISCYVLQLPLKVRRILPVPPTLTFWHRSFTFNSNKSPT